MFLDIYNQSLSSNKYNVVIKSLRKLYSSMVVSIVYNDLRQKDNNPSSKSLVDELQIDIDDVDVKRLDELSITGSIEQIIESARETLSKINEEYASYDLAASIVRTISKEYSNSYLSDAINETMSVLSDVRRHYTFNEVNDLSRSIKSLKSKELTIDQLHSVVSDSMKLLSKLSYISLTGLVNSEHQ